MKILRFAYFIQVLPAQSSFMARFLLFGIVLANLWMLGFMLLPVPSPAPSGGITDEDSGIRRLASYRIDHTAAGEVVLRFSVIIVAVVVFYICVIRQDQESYP